MQLLCDRGGNRRRLQLSLVASFPKELLLAFHIADGRGGSDGVELEHVGGAGHSIRREERGKPRGLAADLRPGSQVL